ncbi:hypothetical protein M422DRAFT_60342 [Sphaerobolus stellatus SS14]|uniref:Biotrophy-associated secreted protein 2 n=1 Tax=Sphaerobolus stellatus (strain SS14) TaxID=990650 RepID=A0A0C9VXL4_SPHS4|nr:hypothetical protein M422DRAFT_60342 [Sphaerobolus stellatus SS14]
MAISTSFIASGFFAGQGIQFITGVCASDAAPRVAAASGGAVSAQAQSSQTRDGGCGFGDAQPNNRAVEALLAPGVLCNGAGYNAETQFITGPCVGDADCAYGCCEFNSGKCAGAVIAQERDGECGFGDAQPNVNAAKKLVGHQRAVTFLY